VRMSSMNGSVEGTMLPQELFTTCGRIAGEGSVPSARVGARIHSPELISAWSAHWSAHPLVATH
jgi:hypothetical protein